MSTIVVCDVCGTRKDVSKVSFAVGRYTDAAGSSEDEVETFDLCLLHNKEVLATAISKRQERSEIYKYDINNIIVGIIKKRISK
jgi:hypothetical protein